VASTAGDRLALLRGVCCWRRSGATAAAAAASDLVLLCRIAAKSRSCSFSSRSDSTPHGGGRVRTRRPHPRCPRSPDGDGARASTSSPHRHVPAQRYPRLGRADGVMDEMSPRRARHPRPRALATPVGSSTRGQAGMERLRKRLLAADTEMGITNVCDPVGRGAHGVRFVGPRSISLALALALSVQLGRVRPLRLTAPAGTQPTNANRRACCVRVPNNPPVLCSRKKKTSPSARRLNCLATVVSSPLIDSIDRGRGSAHVPFARHGTARKEQRGASVLPPPSLASTRP
jgi:hypothetical protein